jgi:hypothetical protein
MSLTITYADDNAGVIEMWEDPQPASWPASKEARMPKDDLDVTDPTFKDDLKESQKYVWKAAKWLNSIGHSAAVNPTYVRPAASQRAEYSDGGDITMLQRVEVKRRKIEFKTKEEWPYPTVMVDVAHTYDSKRPKPFMYIIQNNDATAGFIIMGSTDSTWQRVSRKTAGRVRDHYECPLDQAVFVSFAAPTDTGEEEST